MKKIISLVFALVFIMTCVSTAFAVMPTCGLDGTPTVQIRRGGSQLYVDAATTHANGYRATLTVMSIIDYKCGPSYCGHGTTDATLKKSKSQVATSRVGCRAHVSYTLDCPHVDDLITGRLIHYRYSYLPKD